MYQAVRPLDTHALVHDADTQLDPQLLGLCLDVGLSGPSRVALVREEILDVPTLNAVFDDPATADFLASLFDDREAVVIKQALELTVAKTRAEDAAFFWDD